MNTICPTNCGERMPAMTITDEADTQQAVELVMQHVARYRLSVFAAISRLPAFIDRGPRRIRQVLRQCRDDGWLSSAMLHHSARYWFLTPKGAEHCAFTDQRSGAMCEPAKIRAYAMLRFCCLSTHPRHRLTADELAHSFPDLYRTGMPSTYYFDDAGPGRIGLARVDAGHRGRWDRIVQSIRKDIADHAQQPGFKRLMQASRFEITVLTVLPVKARRIEKSLLTLPQAGRVPVHVVAQPELLPLVVSSR